MHVLQFRKGMGPSDRAEGCEGEWQSGPKDYREVGNTEKNIEEGQ